MESSSDAHAGASPNDARLRIRALGVFCVENPDGGTIPAAASFRRPMAVLLIAAAAGDRGITRDKVLGMLWPESSADRARHSLTQAIYNARRVTGLDDLFLTHGVLRVNAELVSFDVADFEAAIHDGDLERAASLYAGPFLDGFHISGTPEFEQWVTIQRAHYEERAAWVFDELAKRAAQGDKHHDGVEWRRRPDAHAGTPDVAVAHVAPRAWRRGRVVASTLGAAAAIVVVAALVSSLASRGFDERTAGNGSRGLFVAPFSTSGASPAIGYLGRGAAELLAMQLDSAGDTRAIDPAKVDGAWKHAGFDGRPDVPQDSVLGIADQLSARRVVVGSIVGSESRAIVSATLVSLPKGETLARGSVEGPADSVGLLTNRLAAKLLVSAAGEDSLVALRWHPPLAAIGAFLRGRESYQHGQYVDGVRSLRASLRLDSTFAPAAMLLARAADRIGDLDEQDAAIARAWPYRAALDAGDRAELVAMAGPLYPRATPQPSAVEAWARVVKISPQRAGSWYELAARLIREGRRVGGRTANEQANVALNHALVLDPSYGAARDLLTHLTVRIDAGRNAAAAPAMVDTASTLGAFLRWRAALATGDTATLRTLRTSWPSLTRECARAIAMASQFDAVGLDDGARAIALLAARATTTKERVEMTLAAHSMALITNHPAEALALTVRLEQLRPDSHGYLRLRVIDALYGNGDPVAARDAARELSAPLDSSFRGFSLLRVRAEADVCIVGQWKLAHRDTTNFQAMLRVLRSADLRRDEQLISAAPDVCADLLEASLAVATKRREARQLVDRLDELVLTTAVAGNASMYANIAIARMYTALGEPDRALTALRRRTYMAGWPAYLATVWREEARLARVTGDQRRATQSTRRLVSLGVPLSLGPLPH
ncbi:MAG: hypothetical protein ACREPM_03765 [Gemmatimonadaceae bacterium]